MAGVGAFWRNPERLILDTCMSGMAALPSLMDPASSAMTEANAWIVQRSCYPESMRGAKEPEKNVPFDDEKLYDEEAQSFGRITIRNFPEVFRAYSYDRYQKRFRERADANKLSSSQRPKLDEDQFAPLIEKFRTGLLACQGPDPLSDSTNRKTALRLLLDADFEEDEDWR
jgi:hypothetical protein